MIPFSIPYPKTTTPNHLITSRRVRDAGARFCDDTDTPRFYNFTIQRNALFLRFTVRVGKLVMTSKAQCAVIYIERKRRAESRQLLDPHVTLVTSQNCKIPPWLEPTFWCNMRSGVFAELFATKLLEKLKTEDKEMWYRVELTLCFLQTNFNGCFDVYQLRNTRMSTEEFAQLISDLLPIKASCAALLNSAIHQYRLPVPQMALPLFSFVAILRCLRESPRNMDEFLSAVVEVLKHGGSKDELVKLCHVVRVVLTLFNEVHEERLQEISKILQGYLGRSEPLSSLVYQVIKDIGRELELPGSLYYEVLDATTDFNTGLRGSCPCIFGDEAPLVPSFLYSCTVDVTPLPVLYCGFARFFLMNYGRPSGGVLEEQKQFIQMFSLDPDDVERVKQQFHLMGRPCRQSREPKPEIPIIPIATRKFMMDFDIKQCKPIPFAGNLYIYESGLDVILKQSVLTPLGDLTMDSQKANLKIMLVGGDWLLGNFLCTYLSNIVKNRMYAALSLTLYLVPQGACGIGGFLASRDPIYRDFVSNLTRITTDTLPICGESDYAVLMPSVVETDSSECDNHLWYSSPSPSHVFQIGVQHFLHFAKETVAVGVWQCRVTLPNNMEVAVPFLTSVKVEADGKRSVACEYMGVNKKSETLELQKLEKLSFWNANDDNKASPLDPFLLMETTGNSALIITAKVTAVKPGDLKVLIDSRTYGPVKSFSISAFPDLVVKGEQWKILLGTFVPV